MNVNVEVIRALTPIIIGVTGGFVGLVIALVAILTPSLPESKFSVLLNLATGSMATGLGGAAGVAQQNRSGNSRIEVDNIEEVNSEELK